MVKRMLIDAGHAEETRVVVASGTRLEEFDFESAARKQLKGNVYLAKIMRVEPSLQAAFVDYGGNRHGFLPFSEIHPDYYQIPVADREALYAEQKAAEDESAPNAATAGTTETKPDEPASSDETASSDEKDGETVEAVAEEVVSEDSEPAEAAPEDASSDDAASKDAEPDEASPEDASPDNAASAESAPTAEDGMPVETKPEDTVEAGSEGKSEDTAESSAGGSTDGDQRANLDADKVATVVAEQAPDGKPASTTPKTDVETLGGDELEDYERRRIRTSRSILVRRYKIQEVIKKRQIILIQVVKEERGNKGAALTTYLSLAGRYCVLMPNAIRGGGISRKIVNVDDRKRLKAMIGELKVPSLMSVIVRTAGVERSKPEIRRDYDYLMRQWEDIRELTLKSTAPILINEEANLIKIGRAHV